MTDINIKKFLNGFSQNYRGQAFGANGSRGAQGPNGMQNAPAKSSAEVPQPSQSPSTSSSVASGVGVSRNYQLNALQTQGRAVYAKEVLGLPRNMNEFVYMLQRGLTQKQFNQMFRQGPRGSELSSVRAQILSQLQGVNTADVKGISPENAALSSALKNLEISSGMLNLSDISLLLQKNGKAGITKLIMSMTEASKSGISDLSQMKEMAKLINASVAVASENNPPKTLKLLLMLYLPWLPLAEGTDFDIEVEAGKPEGGEGDSILTVTVNTINYGSVKAVLVLETSNSVSMSVNCCKDFPQTELKLRLEGEQKYYSSGLVTAFESDSSINNKGFEKQSTSINMSQTNEISPYLLLAAHSFIKHVISMDNNKSAGIVSHTDNF